jgi:hypothetical protein
MELTDDMVAKIKTAIETMGPLPSGESVSFEKEILVDVGPYVLHVHQHGVISLKDKAGNMCIYFQVDLDGHQIYLASYFDDVNGNHTTVHTCSELSNHPVFFAMLKQLAAKLNCSLHLSDISTKQFKFCKPLKALLVSLAKGQTFYERHGLTNVRMNEQLNELRSITFNEFLKKSDQPPLPEWGVESYTLQAVANKIVNVCDNADSHEMDISLAEMYAARIYEILDVMEQVSEFSWTDYSFSPKGGKKSRKRFRKKRGRNMKTKNQIKVRKSKW